MSIGQEYDGDSTGDYFEGELRELLIFNSELTDEQLAKINYYLSKKWGMESSIDSDVSDSFVDSIDNDPIKQAVVDFSDEVDAQIGIASGLDSIESNLALWLDVGTSIV